MLRGSHGQSSDRHCLLDYGTPRSFPEMRHESANGPQKITRLSFDNLPGCRTHCKISRQCKGIPPLKDNPQIWTQLQYGIPSRGQCDEMFTSKSPPVYFIMLNIKRPTAWNPPKRSRWTGTAVAVAGTMRYEKSSKKCPCW